MIAVLPGTSYRINSLIFVSQWYDFVMIPHRVQLNELPALTRKPRHPHHYRDTGLWCLFRTQEEIHVILRARDPKQIWRIVLQYLEKPCNCVPTKFFCSFYILRGSTSWIRWMHSGHPWAICIICKWSPPLWKKWFYGITHRRHGLISSRKSQNLGFEGQRTW